MGRAQIRNQPPLQNRSRINVHRNPYRQPVVALVFNNRPAPPQRKDPPYFQQPDEVEDKIRQTSAAASYCLTYLIGPKLNHTLISKGKVSPSKSYDLQVHLQILMREVKVNPFFLPSPLSPNVVKRVTFARNDVQHNNWSRIQNNSDQYFLSMIELADCLGEPVVAKEIQEIFDSINAGDCTGGVSFKPFHFPARGYDKMTAFGLQLILEALITKYLVKAIWNFLHAKIPAHSLPPSLDVYANVVDMAKEHAKDPDYLAIGGTNRDDRLVLQLVKELRLDLAHGHYENIFYRFQGKLGKLIQLLSLLGAPDAALEVGVIRDTLVQLKRNGRTVRPSLFPSLF